MRRGRVEAGILKGNLGHGLVLNAIVLRTVSKSTIGRAQRHAGGARCSEHEGEQPAPGSPRPNRSAQEERSAFFGLGSDPAGRRG
jgi:hypothetical protein